jgi:hypothetical protein
MPVSIIMDRIFGSGIIPMKYAALNFPDEKDRVNYLEN